MPWIGSNTSLLRMQDATSSDPLPQALGGQAAPPRMRAWHENLISLVATPPDPVCVVLRRLVWPKALGRPQALLPAPSFPLLLPSSAPFLPRPLSCPQLARLLSGIDESQFDAFKLKEATGGRPLSVLAFALFKNNGLISRFDLHEARLAR